MTSTLEITSVQIAALALLVTLGASLIGLFKMVTAASDSVRKELLAEIEKTEAVLSKSRHELANAVQVSISKLETQTSQLQRETVRREDMLAIEGRLTTMFNKIDGKVDQITDRLAGFAALEKQVLSLDGRLDNAIRRIEGRNS